MEKVKVLARAHLNRGLRWLIIMCDLFEKRLQEKSFTLEKKDNMAFFLSGVIKIFGKRPVYNGGAPHYGSARRALGPNHHIYTFGSWLRSVIESLVCIQTKGTKRMFDTSFVHRKRALTWEYIWSRRELFNNGYD